MTITLTEKLKNNFQRFILATFTKNVSLAFCDESFRKCGRDPFLFGHPLYENLIFEEIMHNEPLTALLIRHISLHWSLQIFPTYAKKSVYIPTV